MQPYEALGAVLAERGHAVTVSTGQGFDDLIEAYGLTAALLSLDMRAIMESTEIKTAMKSVTGWFKAFRSSQDLMPGQLRDMWSVAQHLAPEIVTYNPRHSLPRIWRVPLVRLPSLASCSRFLL